MWKDLPPNLRWDSRSFDPAVESCFSNVQHGNPGMERYPAFYWSMEILETRSKHLESKKKNSKFEEPVLVVFAPKKNLTTGAPVDLVMEWEEEVTLSPVGHEAFKVRICELPMADGEALSAVQQWCAVPPVADGFDGCNSGVHASTGCQLWSSSIVLARHLMARLGFSWTTNVKMQVNCDRLCYPFIPTAFDAWHVTTVSFLVQTPRGRAEEGLRGRSSWKSGSRFFLGTDDDFNSEMGRASLWGPLRAFISRGLFLWSQLLKNTYTLTWLSTHIGRCARGSIQHLLVKVQ